MTCFKQLLASILIFSCSNLAVAEDFAARVNGYPIGTESVERLLSGSTAPNTDGEILIDRRLAATQALVRQYVLIQAAQQAKFDHAPNVRRSLELLKVQVLAEAYLGMELGAGSRSSEAEIDRFIADNPFLFDKRQTIHYHRLEVPQVAGLDDAALAEILRLNKNAPDLAQALRRRGIDFRQQSLWQSAEQIEPEVLKHLQGMANRSVELVNQPEQGRWVVLRRNATYADPVEAEAVRPAIARGLFAEQREARVAELIQRLRSQATIELFDDQSDMAATVNAEPISRQLLEQRMEASGLPANAPKARQRVLDQLIDQHLLAQQAQKSGLAQQPSLLQRVAKLQEASLAAQYLEHSVSAIAKAPGEREIVQFINGRPAFFADRKVFRYEETILARSAQDHLETTQKALEGLNKQQAQRWLSETGSVVARSAPWLGPEALPPQLYSALAKMQPGDTQVIPVNGGQALSVVTLVSIHDDPLDDEQARFVAADILRQQAKAKAAQEIVEKLLSRANIEYAPEYKPRDAVRLTTADWGKRQWAGFSAWTAQFAALVMLLAGTVAFAVKSREQIGFVVPLLNDSSGGSGQTWLQEFSRSYVFLFLMTLMALALASASSLMQWSVIRTLIAQERILAGAAAGAFLGLFLSAGAYLLARGDEAKLALGRWTVLLVPAAATALGTTLVWSVLAR